MNHFPQGETAGVILAGGSSRRFGSPKALALLDGVPLVEIAAHSLGSVVGQVVVSTNDPESLAWLELPTVPDRYPGRGPLAGIHAGLAWAIDRGARGICCLPCDTPLVPPRFLQLLIDSA
jgi:molybdopterin-guanine dinucleotide biosynthesis protein A